MSIPLHICCDIEVITMLGNESLLLKFYSSFWSQFYYLLFFNMNVEMCLKRKGICVVLTEIRGLSGIYVMAWNALHQQLSVMLKRIKCVLMECVLCFVSVFECWWQLWKMMNFVMVLIHKKIFIIFCSYMKCKKCYL